MRTPSARRSTLERWLADMTPAAFERGHFDRAPLARASTARDEIGIFDRAVLARVLRAEPPPDVLVVARGAHLTVPAPRSLPELDALFADGIGIVVRKGERHDRGLADLAACFARELAGDVQLQLFVTPGGTYGFGWHYDLEHVFILQTAGRKDYLFRENTVAPPRPGGAPDFSRVRGERSPVMRCTLLAGDWLYLPRGWWHVARCVEPSLSVSIGVSRSV